MTVDNIQHYIKKSKIKNTDVCTQKWIRSLQKYRKKKSIFYDIQTFNDKNQLEQELCEFFADMKRQDGKPYKPESIVSAYTSLRCYLFEGSAIKNVNINDRFPFPLLYRVVDGKIMELQDQGCFDFQSNGSLIFIIGREKNNQGGLKGRSKYGRFTSYHIHIPADQPNNEFKPIQDLYNYVSLRPLDACEYFYLQITRNAQEINNGNWFSKDKLEKIP
ncbi:hypothetical protein C2G38_2234073 [Gigaspora rosea]|uniref:Uncharacterized protein n=1 Tax=Gigaspora rosea TaxID=44941 RepID=A0A397TVX3_9GLOM|nr:hypothetical protein C2G38_2234073 [Gigaspora rosea]